jgi:hypothetical protein
MSNQGLPIVSGGGCAQTVKSLGGNQVMAPSCASNPSELALAKLREQLEADSTLSDEVKDAVLDDLGSELPATFAKLRIAISAEAISEPEASSSL